LVTPSRRVVSLDALRGFDMFWILGGDAIAGGLARLFPGQPWARVVHEQFAEHVEWGTTSWRDLITFKGIHFYDLIFPLFVFIVGVSVVFSLSRQIAEGGKAKAVRRIIFRSIALWLFGVFVYGGFAKPWPGMRLVGVLQRIAFCYLVAGLLFTFFSVRTLVITAASILVVYWAILTFVKMPGESKVSFEEGHNIANWIDYKYLPGRKWDAEGHGIPHDPEGLLSSLPAIVTCLLGVFAGVFLRSSEPAPWKKGTLLILCGAASVAVGILWGLQFPVIKKLWTSSYVLVAGGYSAMLLGIFYLIIDVAKFRIWAKPFIWIGMNAILLYILKDGGVIPFRDIASRLMGGDISTWLDSRHKFGSYQFHLPGLSSFVGASVAMLLVLMVARFFYKRQIFLRV
jgi:predicted acyltransferase